MSDAKVCDICGRIICNDGGGYTLKRVRIAVLPIHKDIDFCNSCYARMIEFCTNAKEQEHERID